MLLRYCCWPWTFLTSVSLHNFVFYHHPHSLSAWLLTCIDRIYLHDTVENSLLSASEKKCPVYYTCLIGSTFSLISLHFISKNTHLSRLLKEQQLLTHSKVSLYGTSASFIHICNTYHLSMSKPRFQTNLMLFYKMGGNWTWQMLMMNVGRNMNYEVSILCLNRSSLTFRNEVYKFHLVTTAPYPHHFFC